MTEYIKTRDILGITEERQDEIGKEVTTTLSKSGTVDGGIKILMEKYDPESLMAGMKLMILIKLNNELHNRLNQHKLMQQPGLN